MLDSISRCGNFGIASVLQQFRATQASTCCIVTFSFIGGTSVLEFLQPFFLVLNNANHGRSDHKPEILFDAEPAGSNRFSPLRLLRRRKWARIFLAGFRPDIEKMKRKTSSLLAFYIVSRRLKIDLFIISFSLLSILIRFQFKSLIKVFNKMAVLSCL